MPAFRPCVRPLVERVDGNGGHGRERQERADGHGKETPMAALGLSALTFELLLPAPGKHRVAENVVEDLVSRPVRTRAVDGSDDSLPTERGEDRQQALLVDRG